MNAAALRVLRRASQLTEVCEAGPSRPRSFRTSAVPRARTTGVRQPRPHSDVPRADAAAPDTSSRKEQYAPRVRVLSPMYIPGQRPKVLINQYLDKDTLPFDVPARRLRAVRGAIEYCLQDETDARLRLALRIAHLHLALTLEPSPHTSVYQGKRSHQYAVLVGLFLAERENSHAMAVNHDSAWSLLKRQRQEQVPLSFTVAGRVFDVLRPRLGEVLPQLPQMDQPQYAHMLRLLVMDYAPPPSELRKLVRQTFREEEEWGYDLHAALVYSHFPSVDFRGALVALGALRAQVMRDKDLALQNGTPWPPENIAVVEASYTDVMSLWSRSRFTRSRRNARLNSEAPSKLAADLLSVLRPPNAGEGEASLPTPFLNAWFNAERIAQNDTHVDEVWRFLSGSSIEETLAGHIARPVEGDTLVALLKYLKVHKSSSGRGSVRGLLRCLPLDDNRVLNAFIALLAIHHDLPVLTALLRSDLGLDPRSIDLACAALIYALRDVTAGPWATQAFVVDGLKFPSDSGASSNNIYDVEWDWVARLLALRDAPTSLPLSLPTAQLEETARFDAEEEAEQHYGDMIRVVGSRDRLDKRVEETRHVLADVVQRAAEVLARREGRSAEDLSADMAQAEHILKQVKEQVRHRDEVTVS